MSNSLRSSSRLWARAALALVLLAGFSGAESATAAERPAPRSTTFATGIERDPQTGGWRLAPVAVEDPFLALALRRSDEGLTARPLAGGGEIVDLEGRYQCFAVARITRDGTLATGCLEDPLDLLTWLGAPAVPRRPAGNAK